MGQELINFLTFDAFIEEELDRNLAYSHRLINEKDKPEVIDSLREYLLKNIGCFSTVGYVKITDIGYWFERETMLEVFDDLLLKFRDYLGTTKGLITTEQYTLVRYQDHVNFVITPQQEESSLYQDFSGIPTSHAEVHGLKVAFDTLETDLEEAFSGRVDVTGLMRELKGDNFEGLLSKYLIPETMNLLD